MSKAVRYPRVSEPDDFPSNLFLERIDVPTAHETRMNDNRVADHDEPEARRLDILPDAHAVAGDGSSDAAETPHVFEPPAIWSAREFESAKMELMSLAGKSTGTAYLFWFFYGMAGGHRFYLGKFQSGVVMLVSLWLSALTAVVLIGFLGLAVLFVWWIVDAVRLGGMVEQHNRRVATLMADVCARGA